jgi:cytochrome d ubiquinol oxidase subunit I
MSDAELSVFLSRVQFGLTISFHYIFPPLNIGLGVLLVAMEGFWLKTGKQVYKDLARFWALAFGLMFAIGVASGLVMEFQFGTNWSNYSRFVGDVFGSALAAEGIFAFFLESGFLGLVLFGWDRVRPKVHFFATIMVALGAHFSAVWIVVANSWQQTPAGYHLVEKDHIIRAEVTSFWQVVFNPSSMDRLSHVLSGAWLAGAFLVLSVSAFYLLRNRHVEFAKAGIKIALVIAAGASLLQLATGHKSGVTVARYQPIKLAGYEAHFDKEAPADMWLFGIPDMDKQTVRFGVKVPGMLSFLATGNPKTPIPGLNSVKPDDWPPVPAIFQTYHAMVGIGMTLILLSWLGVFFWWRGTLFEKRWMLWIFVFAVLLPELANQLGWFSAELGRQPWVVQGLLRTADAGSPSVPSSSVIASLIGFGIVYALLFALFIYLLNEKIQHGPGEPTVAEQEHKAGIIKGEHRA